MLAAASMILAGAAIAADTKKPPAPNCRPGDRQVAVFSASKCSVLGAKTYPTTALAGLEGEPIVSIEFGSGAITAVVCGIDDNFDLECTEQHFSAKNKQPSRPWTYLRVAAASEEIRCRPKETEIAISGDFYRIGPCIRRRPGRYEDAEALGLASAGSSSFSTSPEELLQNLRKAGTLLIKSKSLRVEAGLRAQARICDREGPQPYNDGKCTNVRHGSSERADLRSVYVWEYCYPKANQVGIFDERDAFGACTIREVGEYLTSDALRIDGALGGASVLLGSDVQARRCSDANLKGDCVDARGPAIINGDIGSLVVRMAETPSR